MSMSWLKTRQPSFSLSDSDPFPLSVSDSCFGLFNSSNAIFRVLLPLKQFHLLLLQFHLFFVQATRIQTVQLPSTGRSHTLPEWACLVSSSITTS